MSTPTSMPPASETEELAALLRGLERCPGFGLFLAQANTPRLRRAITAWLREGLSRPLVEVTLQPQQPVYEQLAQAADDIPPDAILSATGIENLSDAEDADWLLRQLNWRRGVFPRLERPLLLWLPEYLLIQLLRHAPDFADWQRGFYEFTLVEAERASVTELAVTSAGHDLEAHTPEERRQRITRLRGLLDEYAEADDPETDAARARIHRSLGKLYRASGNFGSARDHLHRALALRETLHGPDDVQVAEVVNDLGVMLRDLGKLVEARVAFERVLAIVEVVYGSDHPNVATIINNLGSVLHDLGELAEARATYERALAIDEEVYGPDHPNVAITINNLGSVLHDLGELVEAQAALERALAILQATYSDEHPQVATGHNNLGNVLYDLGELAGARGAYERALVIREKVYGREHPNTGATLWWLGVLEQDSGNVQKAREYFEETLHVFTKFLPPEHPNIKNIKDYLTALPE